MTGLTHERGGLPQGPLQGGSGCEASHKTLSSTPPPVFLIEF